MTEALKLGGSDLSRSPRIRRVNRLPVTVAIVLVVLFLAVIFYGLSSRGLRFGDSDPGFSPGSQPASTHADQLTRGIPDAVIGEPENGLPLVYLPIEDVSQSIAFGIASLTELRRSRAADAFVDYCREVIRDGALPGMLPAGQTECGPDHPAHQSS